MNTLKIAVASLGLVSIVGLAACQNQPKPADRADLHPDRKEMRGDHKHRFDKVHKKDGHRFDKNKAMTEEQKAAIIDILAEDADDDMKAAREKKKREQDREKKKNLMPHERPGAREADIEIQRARKGSHN